MCGSLHARTVAILPVLTFITVTLQLCVLYTNMDHLFRNRKDRLVPVQTVFASDVNSTTVRLSIPQNLDTNTTRNNCWLQTSINREEALIFPVQQINRKFLTIGIPTIQREKESYVFQAVDSLLTHTTEKEQSEILLLILLADSDPNAKATLAREFHRRYKHHISQGVMHVIHAPKSFYPSFENLKRTYDHPENKVKWRSKQNYDYVFQLLYSRNLSDYYMQLEDDVITVSGFYQAIKDYINQQTSVWVLLEFSELGFIGKLYHTEDLEKLAKTIALFYQEQPGDVTFLYFNYLMTQFDRRIRKPTLFQHIGFHSSLAEKTQPLKDKYFDNTTKIYKGDNPPARIFTSLKIQPEFPPWQAYSKDDGYFWTAGVPGEKDTFTVIFTKPHKIKRVVIESGSREHPQDMIYNGILEGSLSLVNNTGEMFCTNDVRLGTFENGKVDVENVHAVVGTFKLQCLRITFPSPQQFWVIIREIAVFLF